MTTQSEQDLKPIQENYKQNIQKVYDAQGQFTGTFSHILRVYLIDKNKQLRNIYSVAILHPDTLINDVKTLLQPKPKQVSAQDARQKNVDSLDVFSVCDNKSNYEHSDYQTQSIALTDRQG